MEIEGCVDERGNVVDDASPRLASLRAEIGELARHIDRGIRRIASRGDLRRFLGDGQAGRIHRRAGRQVLAVKAWHLGQVPGIVHDRSQSEGTLFVEPQELVEPGNRLQALRSDESREVARILAELTRRVLEEEDAIAETAGRVAELELAAVGARWALDVGGCPALLPGEPGAAGELLLRSMRHPLLVQEASEGHIPEAVPIDLRLGGDFDLLVITGPNTGGKTLALKSAGLAALLTRMGLPLPCEAGTTVPLYDGVVADIGDEQEVQQNLSTFSSHLKRISEGLARATPRTLVLLDELGGGTDPDEGAALGDALLEVLLERGVPTLASTHLGVLKEFAFRNARVENACAEFDSESLRPLYRLLVGTPGDSRALLIARRLGLEPDVVDRAEARLRRPHAEVERLMSDVRTSREAAERVRSEAEERLRGLEQEGRELEEERGELARSRAVLHEEADRALEERIRDALPRIQRARALLAQLPREKREELDNVLRELDEHLKGEVVGERRQAFLSGLRKGMLVFLPRYQRRCPVTRIDRQRRQLSVRLGKHVLTIPFDEVSAYEAL